MRLLKDFTKNDMAVFFCQPYAHLSIYVRIKKETLPNVVKICVRNSLTFRYGEGPTVTTIGWSIDKLVPTFFPKPDLSNTFGRPDGPKLGSQPVEEWIVVKEIHTYKRIL